MKKILVLITLFICATQSYAQEASGTLTKEMICRGAAVSVVGNVKPFADRGFTKDQLAEIIAGLVKEPIKDAPNKAYDLFKANKTQEEVTEILYNDFMKLDDDIVFQFLINGDPED